MASSSATQKKTAANPTTTEQNANQQGSPLFELCIHEYKVDFTTVAIETMPHQYQRKVDQAHVDKLADDFNTSGIIQQDRVVLKGILLTDLPPNRTTVIKNARIYLFIGQHRGLATQKAWKDKPGDINPIWPVTLYKKELLSHPGALRGIITSDNTPADKKTTGPQTLSDRDIIIDFFRLPNAHEAKIYSQNFSHWRNERTLTACARSGIFEHFKALSEAASWVIEKIAVTGLRDLPNASMDTVLCDLIAEITEWWTRILWNGEAYEKLKFGAKTKATDTKKASRAAGSLVEQMKAQGADFSLVMSGPKENRGLTSCEGESVDWFFGPEVPTHVYITVDVKAGLIQAGSLASGVMWLLIDEHGMNKCPTSTWRDTQEGKLIKDGTMSVKDLKEFHFQCWRLREQWPGDLKKETILESLMVSNEEFRKLILACPFKDVEKRVENAFQRINGPTPALHGSMINIVAFSNEQRFPLVPARASEPSAQGSYTPSTESNLQAPPGLLAEPIPTTILGTVQEKDHQELVRQDPSHRDRDRMQTGSDGGMRSDSTDDMNNNDGGPIERDGDPPDTDGDVTMEEMPVPSSSVYQNLLRSRFRATSNDENEDEKSSGESDDQRDEENYEESDEENDEERDEWNDEESDEERGHSIRDKTVSFVEHRSSAQAISAKNMNSQTLHRQSGKNAASSRALQPSLRGAQPFMLRKGQGPQLSRRNRALYDELLAIIHEDVHLRPEAEIQQYLSDAIDLIRDIPAAREGNKQHSKKRRANGTPATSVIPQEMGDVSLLQLLVESVKYEKSLYIVGGGISVPYDLPVFRSGSGKKLKDEYQNARDWNKFFTNSKERERLWGFARDVMYKRCQDRGMMHTFLNYLARRGSVTTIVSTNVDALEIMFGSQLPTECKKWPLFSIEEGSLDSWITSDTQCFLQLHGRIDFAECNSCHSKVALESWNIVKFMKGEPPNCNICRNPKRSNAGALKTLWKPSITFHNDDEEETAAEDKDKGYNSVQKRGNKIATDSASDLFEERYAHALCQLPGIELPAKVFVIGSSLSNDRLFKDVKRLSLNFPTIVVDPQWNSRFSALENVSYIQATAEHFAGSILRKLNSELSASS